MILAKHILILGMIAMGFWYNPIWRVGLLMRSNTDAAQAISHFCWSTNAIALCGLLVLLLTTLAQLE